MKHSIQFLLIAACTIVAMFLPTSATAQSYIQGKLSWEIQDLHANYRSNPQYQSLINDYDRLAAGVNGVYQRAAKEIANGYLTKNRQIIRKRPDYVNAIERFDQEGQALLMKIRTAKDPGIDAMGVGEILSLIMFIKDLAEPIIKNQACESAKNFYQSVYWPSSAEVISGNQVNPSMNFLGAGCN